VKIEKAMQASALPKAWQEAARNVRAQAQKMPYTTYVTDFGIIHLLPDTEYPIYGEEAINLIAELWFREDHSGNFVLGVHPHTFVMLDQANIIRENLRVKRLKDAPSLREWAKAAAGMGGDVNVGELMAAIDRYVGKDADDHDDWD